MQFNFYTPTKLIVGQGKVKEIGNVAGDYGKKPFVVVGQSAYDTGTADLVIQCLNHAGLKPVLYTKPAGEPDQEMTDQTSEEARKQECDFVISVGGGSVIDLAKAVSGLVTNPGSVEDYLEGVGKGRKLQHKAIPHIAVPTTAGTGAEVTRNAVISSKKKKYKKSFRHPSLYPELAILDAELSVHLPAEQTAYSGMDAITQLIESYITWKANPITDALALQGLFLAFHSIRVVVDDGKDLTHRENLLLASTLSGICLANAGLGLAHGFASGLGALYDAPHGKVCAIMLPHAMRYNKEISFNKLSKIGNILLDGNNISDQEAVDWILREIDQLNKKFNIPKNLKEFNIKEEDKDLLVQMSMGNSMGGNPAEITPEKAHEILNQLL